MKIISPIICALLLLVFPWSLKGQDCGCNFILQNNGVLTKNGVELNPKKPWDIYGDNFNIKPGDVICLKSGRYAYGIRFYNLTGTEANPIVIKNCEGLAFIDSPTYGVIFLQSKHFKFLGNGVSSIKYGIKVTAKDNDKFFIDAKDFSTNFEIAYIEVAGASDNPFADTVSFAGIGAKTNPLCDHSADRGNFTMYKPIIHDNYIHHTGGEGIYLGYGFYKEKEIPCPCNPPVAGVTCPEVVYPHSIVGARVYNNITEHTGYDGIQIKNTDSDCEVYNNVIKNYGVRNEAEQNEGLVLGPGVTGKAYNNWIEGGTGNGIQCHSMGNQDIYNNVVINANEYGFVCWDGPSVVRVGYYNIFNNTFINSGVDGFMFYSPGGGPKRFYNNIIAKVGRNLFKVSPDVVLFEESNNYATNNIADVKFISGAAPFNCHLQSTSPVIDKGKNLTSYGIKTDFDNAPRPSGATFDIGAYEFGNIPPTVSITQPLANATFTPGSTIVIIADAKDTDGSISKVEFFNGATKLGEDASAPYEYSWANVPAGTYTIKVVATDNGGSTSSATITVNVKNIPPTVSITKPTNNSSVSAGKSLNIEATATDPDGNISKVEFYYTLNNKDTILIGSDLTSPYSTPWTPNITGTYKVIAKATDNLGATSLIAITVKVTNTLPTITITAPLNNSNFAFGQDINFNVNTADADGNIVKVEYYNGTTKIGESTNTPFSFSWTNVPLGTYTITAKATDNVEGTTTSLPIQISVVNKPPVVTITSPSNNAKFSPGANITISATATDEDGIITKVDFYYNGTLLIGSDNTSPYSSTWTNVPEGTYTITAKATDNAGATSTNTININVVNNLPTVKITAPANLSVYQTGADIEITADASDSDGSISKVVFYNGTTILGEDLAGPYSFSWLNVQNGTYSITAVAYDNLGKQNVSTAVKIIVNVTTNIPPDIEITSPTNNQILPPGNITLTAAAVDVDGNILLVEFFNGSTKIGESTSQPYSINWNIETEGDYVITAKATDNDNETNSSLPVTVTIFNKPPVLSILSPTNGQTFNSQDQITINTTATDEDGTIIKVEFYLEDILIGALTSEPYNFVWNNPPLGAHNITVKATDNLNKIDSKTIQLSITNTIPVISITSPNSGASFDYLTPVTFRVNANDIDGSVVKVEYYSNGKLIGEANSGDFSFTWTDGMIGVYEIVAFATDNDGGRSSSIPISISIEKRTPTIVLTSPAANEAFEADETIGFTVSISDPDGTITKVEYYSNGIKIGEGFLPDYSFNWNNATSGSFEVYAVVTEENGDRDTSNKVNITINNPNKKPLVTIISPIENSKYSYCSEITLEASASDDDGSISKVEFSINDQLVGTDNTPPYSLTIQDVDLGYNTFVATAYDNKGSETSTDITFIVSTPPSATFNVITKTDTISSAYEALVKCTNKDTLSFFNTTDISQSNIKSFEWILSDGTTSANSNFVHNFSKAGLYRAQLVVTDAQGCKSPSNEVNILVKDTVTAQPYWVPNAFSPHEKNPENKVVKVYGKISEDDFSFTIYSRWGQVLYETKSFPEANRNGWTGDDAPMGTYTYILKGKEENGKKIEESGTITLIR